MQMARMRLCSQAAFETQMVMKVIVNEVLETNPEFSCVLVPKCLAHNGCNEFKSCGWYKEQSNE